MDVNLIKERLAAQAQPKAKKTELVDYAKTFWKPGVGKHEIRIVPSKFNKLDPFREVQFHYGIGGKKVMLALTNFGEKDPIVEFINKLKETGDKENWNLIKKISPKKRYFAPVVVRGEEDKGVRLWEFGTQMWKDLCNLAADDEIGDYTDIVNGRDIKINTEGKEVTKTDYNKSTPTIKLKVSKLSEDKQEVKLWLEEQPDVLSCYKHYSFDEMKSLLENWLKTPQSDDDSPKAESKPSKSNVAKAPVKKSKTDEFDEVFKDAEGEGDDLPF
jgi:hypothetical protein